MSVNPLSVSAYITIELQYPDFLKKTCHFESHFERRNFVKWEQLILKGFCPCKKMPACHYYSLSASVSKVHRSCQYIAAV